MSSYFIYTFVLLLSIVNLLKSVRLTIIDDIMWYWLCTFLISHLTFCVLLYPPILIHWLVVFIYWLFTFITIMIILQNLKKFWNDCITLLTELSLIVIVSAWLLNEWHISASLTSEVWALHPCWRVSWYLRFYWVLEVSS